MTAAAVCPFRCCVRHRIPKRARDGGMEIRCNILNCVQELSPEPEETSRHSWNVAGRAVMAKQLESLLETVVRQASESMDSVHHTMPEAGSSIFLYPPAGFLYD